MCAHLKRDGTKPCLSDQLNSCLIVEIRKRICPCGATFYQKVDFFAILGAVFPTSGSDWREILHG